MIDHFSLRKRYLKMMGSLKNEEDENSSSILMYAASVKSNPLEKSTQS